MNFLLLFMLNLSLRRCVDCQFFKKDFLTDPKFGKCMRFPKEVHPDYYWVTGIKENPKIEYYYCAVARDVDSMCGMQGNKFEPRT